MAADNDGEGPALLNRCLAWGSRGASWADDNAGSQDSQERSSSWEKFCQFDSSKGSRALVIVLIADIVYVPLYAWFSPEGNTLPQVGTSLHATTVLAAILAARFSRPHVTATISSASLLVAAFAFGLGHPEVQVSLGRETKWVHVFGPPPSCAFQDSEVVCLISNSHYTTMAFQLLHLVYVVFILEFKFALPLSICSVGVYSLVLVVAHDQHPAELLLLGLSAFVAVTTKWAVESALRQLSMQVKEQSQELVDERARRCETELRVRELELRSSAPLAPLALDVNKMPSDTRTINTEANTEVVFESLASSRVGRSVRHVLQELDFLGRREHWLIHSGELTLETTHVLGSGCFGRVVVGDFRGTPVAVKLARGIWSQDAHEGVQQLADELRALRHVRHPNIVLLHGVCIDSQQEQLGLVLELLHGETLEARVLQGPKLDDRGRYCVVRDLCRALLYLHSRQPTIVHGDLKPSNAFIEELAGRPRAKLLDFGLSRVLSQRSRPLGGTMQWMAPEVQEENLPAAASDTFSLGRVMFFVASGQFPLGAADGEVNGAAQLNGATQLSPWPTTEMAQVCRRTAERCMHSEAGQRPHMSQVLAEVLQWPHILDFSAACSDEVVCGPARMDWTAAMLRWQADCASLDVHSRSMSSGPEWESSSARWSQPLSSHPPLGEQKSMRSCL